MERNYENPKRPRYALNDALQRIEAAGRTVEVVSMDSGWGRLYLLENGARLQKRGAFFSVDFRSNNRTTAYLSARMPTASPASHLGRALDTMEKIAATA